jgi:hypothetical protein
MIGAESQILHRGQSDQEARSPCASAAQFLRAPVIWRDPLWDQQLPVFTVWTEGLNHATQFNPSHRAPKRRELEFMMIKRTCAKHKAEHRGHAAKLVIRQQYKHVGARNVI